MDRHRARWSDVDLAVLRAMTSEGKSAREIAVVLGRHRPAIEYRRHRDQILVGGDACRGCNTRLRQPTKGRRKLWCTLACRDATLAARAEEERVTARQGLCCESCGVDLDPEGFARKYCGKPCAKRAWHLASYQTPRRKRQLARSMARYRARRKEAG